MPALCPRDAPYKCPLALLSAPPACGCCMSRIVWVLHGRSENEPSASSAIGFPWAPVARIFSFPWASLVAFPWHGAHPDPSRDLVVASA